MTEYNTILTNDEFDNFIKSIPQKKVLLFPANKIIYAKKTGNIVTLNGLFFLTRLRIINFENGKLVEMKTRYVLPLYFIVPLLLLFFFMFLYADKVTINGNPDPSFIERIVFVIVGLIMFSIPIGIFVKLKSDFIKKIELELKLKKTTKNKG